ncbi:porin [Ferrimonas kyonanensis]|uniref:porin n=1 Tax=Ferrimonas kyonanensis TaxID=364763 RepID=UPI00047F2BF7|nr:porin [Ferrimonas kyonanensis]
MNTKMTLMAAAIAAVSVNAVAADSLEEQVRVLSERVQQLEQQTPTLAEGTSFNLYGSLRPTFNYLDDGDNGKWDVRDALSRVGIKAQTELSNGWVAIAQGEWSVDISNNGDFGKARQAYVALATPYGQLGVGKQRPAQYTLVAEYVDIFNHGNSPFAYDAESPFFVDNFVTYKLQKQGFTLMAGAQINGDKGDDNADMVNVGVGYDLAGLHLGLGYVTQDRLDDSNQVVGDDQTIGGVVAYSFDNGLYLAAAYQDKDYNLDNGVDRSGSTLDTALAYPFADQYKVKLGYFIFEDGVKDNSSKDYDGYNTTLEWNAADNLRFHVEYLVKDFDYSDKDTSIAVGMRYDFDLGWNF